MDLTLTDFQLYQDGGGDSGKLCAMRSCLRLETFPPPEALELRTTESAGQCLTY